MEKKEIIKSKNTQLANRDLYNLSDNKVELKHQVDPKAKCYSIRSVNVTPDNRYLIVTNEDNPRIRVIDLQMLEHMPHKYNTHESTVRLTSITRDGSIFYTASWDGSSHRYEVETGKSKSVINKCGNSMPSCYISDDERFLFTANYEKIYGVGYANKGRCLDLKTNKLYIYQHQPRKRYAGSMDIAYDGRFVYSGSDDGTCHKWSLKQQRSLMKYFDIPVTVRKIAITKRFVAAACSDGAVRVFLKASGKKYKHFVHSISDESMDVRITKDESRLISASEDGSVICFDLQTRKVIFHKKIHPAFIWSACLFNDDSLIASGSTDGTVGITNFKGELIARYYNLVEDELLITCPPKPNDPFANGCFYATNKSLIKVYVKDKEQDKQDILRDDDIQRLKYIDKLNCKNIIISRIHNQAEYENLVKNYSQDKNLLNKANNYKNLKQLRAQNLQS